MRRNEQREKSSRVYCVRVYVCVDVFVFSLFFLSSFRFAFRLYALAYNVARKSQQNILFLGKTFVIIHPLGDGGGAGSIVVW